MCQTNSVAKFRSSQNWFFYRILPSVVVGVTAHETWEIFEKNRSFLVLMVTLTWLRSLIRLSVFHARWKANSAKWLRVVDGDRVFVWCAIRFRSAHLSDTVNELSHMLCSEPGGDKMWLVLPRTVQFRVIFLCWGYHYCLPQAIPVLHQAWKLTWRVISRSILHTESAVWPRRFIVQYIVRQINRASGLRRCNMCIGSLSSSRPVNGMTTIIGFWSLWFNETEEGTV